MLTSRQMLDDYLQYMWQPPDASDPHTDATPDAAPATDAGPDVDLDADLDADRPARSATA